LKLYLKGPWVPKYLYSKMKICKRICLIDRPGPSGHPGAAGAAALGPWGHLGVGDPWALGTLGPSERLSPGGPWALGLWDPWVFGLGTHWPLGPRAGNYFLYSLPVFSFSNCLWRLHGTQK